MVVMKLIDIYEGAGIRAGALEFLYELMKERDPEINISHRELPSFEQHRGFVTRRPYRFWYLIEVPAQAPREGLFGVPIFFEPTWVGYISATQANEIGVVLYKLYRGRGYGPAAIQQLMQWHHPNPPAESSRNGHWLANIAPQNEHSKRVFHKLGFRKIQETYALEEEPHGQETGPDAPA